jgi:uncharacterized protein YlbG (UPF0298 family)
MIVEYVNETEVEKIIKNLKNASAGYDGVHAKVVKASYKEFLTPLTHVMNLSLLQGTFPDTMKIAKVIPLYKSGDHMSISNYRPVSILPLFSKILERLMYSRIISFMNRNSILYKYQFGFREGHSTNMALLVLAEQILSAIDNGEFVVGVFLDFKKAFDTVNHNIVLNKLYKYGIRGIAHSWIKDYLLNRQQYVSFNYVESSKQNIVCGVPQGSILGPLLFLLYVNDIANISDDIIPIIFADDTNIFMRGRSIENTIQCLNDELSKIVVWLNANKLSLNVSKTHYMVFRSKNRKIEINKDLKINDTLIDLVTSTKFIGVILDSTLKWEQHIQVVKSKIAKELASFVRQENYLQRKFWLHYIIAWFIHTLLIALKYGVALHNCF